VDGGGAVTFHKVPIIFFPKWLTTVSFAYFVNKQIAPLHFDIIHTHERIFSADLCTVHSLPHHYWVKKIRRKKLLSLFDLGTIYVEKKLAVSKKCRLFMPVSRTAQDIIVEEFPQLGNKTQVMHPGVDTTKFAPCNTPAQKKARKGEFGFAEEDTVLLFIGMNFELKGLDNIMTALKLMNQDASKKLKLLVVGKGDVAKYSQRAKDIGIDKDVVFTGPRTDMENIYCCGDLLILLSEFDTFGMVVLEAMASSLPVIISETVGAKDLVNNGANGFVVPRDDIKTICSNISAALNPLVYEKMAGNAFLTAQDHSWDNKAETIMTVYEQLSAKIAQGKPAEGLI
jgi:UDP-glucose:(heptosyl)LPS alpha-1,3-glucosyltransferase